MNIREVWQRIRARTAGYLANADPLTEAANSGAFLVWSSQPLYPLYVWLLVGSAAWPALLTWLSTPVFFAVPLLARRSAAAGRSLFVGAGVANTLLATKAFGTASAVGWFLVPCLVISLGFFRPREWRAVAALGLFVGLAAWLLPHLGPPLHAYGRQEAQSLSRLNLWSVVVLSIYLAVAAYRAHRRDAVERPRAEDSIASTRRRAGS